jgi:hypothetical protein
MNDTTPTQIALANERVGQSVAGRLVVGNDHRS